MERRNSPFKISVDASKISGFAAVYWNGEQRTQATLRPGFVERFLPGAFDEWFNSNADALGAYDHDERILLGRRSSGSMKLELRPEGLYYEIPFDATDPDHQKVAAKIRRGDVTGSSFTFGVIDKAVDQEFRNESGLYIRNIKRVMVAELGPTPLPAYAGATAELRSALADQSQVESLLTRAKQACIIPPYDIEFL